MSYYIQDRETIAVDFGEESLDALLFEVRGEDDKLQAFAQSTGGVIYTWLDCDGAQILLRGRHYVNRIWYLVLPAHAPEEIDISYDPAN